MNSLFFLVGGFSPTPLINHGVSNSWDDEITNVWEMKFHGSKPPTSFHITLQQFILALENDPLINDLPIRSADFM